MYEEPDAEEVVGDKIGDGEPELEQDMLIYFHAFYQLRDDRQFTMGGITRISYLAIERWAKRNGVTDDFWIFHRLIMAMDEEYMAWAVEESKRAEKEAEQGKQ